MQELRPRLLSIFVDTKKKYTDCTKNWEKNSFDKVLMLTNQLKTL